MTKSEDEKLSEVVNFRLAHNVHEELINYLKQMGETISKFMREATFNYLKMKQKLEDIENGNHNEI